MITDPNCPSWCADPPGHPFDPADRDGKTELRFHENIAGRLDLDEAGNVIVGLTVMETRIAETAITYLTEPLIDVVIWTPVDAARPLLTADQAREFARCLVAAADQLDAVSQVVS